MSYKYINITAKPQELGYLLSPENTLSRDIAREIYIAEAAPLLLEALEGMIDAWNSATPAPILSARNAVAMARGRK